MHKTPGDGHPTRIRCQPSFEFLAQSGIPSAAPAGALVCINVHLLILLILRPLFLYLEKAILKPHIIFVYHNGWWGNASQWAFLPRKFQNPFLIIVFLKILVAQMLPLP